MPTITQNSGGQGVPQNPYAFGGTGVQDRTTGWVHCANRHYSTLTGGIDQLRDPRVRDAVRGGSTIRARFAAAATTPCGLLLCVGG